MEKLPKNIIKVKKVIDKKLPPKTNMAESFGVAILLALVGGYLDIYSYLARGKVFANTQTGNLVLLGYNVAIRNMEKVLYYLIAIFAFMSGVCVAKVVEYKFGTKKQVKWLHIVILLEIGILFCVMFIPEGPFNIVANVLVSFVCGLQVQGFRKVCGKNYSTIMFTGNLKNLGDLFTHYILTKENEALGYTFMYLGITLMFIAGGWLGALTTMTYGIKAVGLITFVLIGVLIILYRESKQKQK